MNNFKMQINEDILKFLREGHNLYTKESISYYGFPFIIKSTEEDPHVVEYILDEKLSWFMLKTMEKLNEK